MDITEPHTAGVRAAQNAALARIAGRVARIGGWSLDLARDRVDWSDEVCAIHEMPAGTQLSLAEGLNFYPTEDRLMIAAAIAACAQNGAAFALEQPLVTAQQRRVWVRVIGEAVRDAKCTITHVQGSLQDITEAQEKLRQAQAMAETAGRLGKIGAWAIELPQYDLTWSDEVCFIHDLPPGYKPTFAEGTSYFLPENRAEVESKVKACAAHGIPYNFEVPKLTAKGRRIWVRSTGEAVRDSDGRIIRLQGAFQDISERKELESQILRAQRMESIGTLASGIAHDLNNVLSPIVLGAGLIELLDPREEILAIVKNVEQSARRGADLVKQVLSFARGVEGSRVPIQLQALVREIESIVANSFPKQITFEPEIAPDLWLVVGDPTQLNQVVLNLCVNARDAMPTGGRILVSVRNLKITASKPAGQSAVAAGKYVALEVADTGCGMPPEIMERIFEPFYTTKALGKGTGLGLSTVLGIVRSHGGFVNVTSEVAKGSRFTVYLPARIETGAPIPTEVSPALRPRGHGELILLVEDEASILNVTKRTLETFGYRVLTASNGAEAIELYVPRQAEIALVLTDMMMPVMAGPALIVALRRANPAVKVIAASGLLANADPDRPATSTPRHFLAKPYSADAMLTMIEQVLSARIE
jgi:signal transduction histidine kinase/CheY-like chemotaxis protein